MKRTRQNTLFHSPSSKEKQLTKDTPSILELTRNKEFLEGSSDMFDLLAYRDFKKQDELGAS